MSLFWINGAKVATNDIWFIESKLTCMPFITSLIVSEIDFLF